MATIFYAFMLGTGNFHIHIANAIQKVLTLTNLKKSTKSIEVRDRELETFNKRSRRFKMNIRITATYYFGMPNHLRKNSF